MTGLISAAALTSAAPPAITSWTGRVPIEAPATPMGPPFPWNNAQPGYPQTPDGQFRYLRDLVAMSAASGAVAGIRPWAPDYCLAPGGWEPMSLFTGDGAAKPALDAIQQALYPRIQP